MGLLCGLLDRSVKSRDGTCHTYNLPIDVLLLCTANQCRSPMAEALMRHRLESAGVAATVSSAGMYPGGASATNHAQATMAERGLDLSHHVSRTFDRPLINAADLVIGMTREHVREAVAVEPEALGRTFTLKELVRAGDTVGGRRPAESLEDWLDRASAGRELSSLVGVGHDDAYDIADPVGGSRLDYDTTANELDHLLGLLVTLVWPVGDNRKQECNA